MSGEEVVEVEGKITAVLPSTMFRAELENGHQVLAHISGKLRKHFKMLSGGNSNQYDNVFLVEALRIL